MTYAHGGKLWWGLAGLGAFFTAIYMCRLLYVTFFGEFRGTREQAHHLHESPRVMTIPLMVLAALSIVGGFLNTPHFMHLGNEQWLAHWFAGNGLGNLPVIPMLEVHLDASTEWTLMIFTTSLAMLVIVALYFVYARPANLPVSDNLQKGFTRLIAHKFYVDEIYDALLVNPIAKFSKFLHYYVDIWAIDGLVNGIGRGAQALGGGFRRLQNGNIEYYLFGMVAGAVLLFLSLFL